MAADDIVQEPQVDEDPALGDIQEFPNDFTELIRRAKVVTVVVPLP